MIRWISVAIISFGVMVLGMYYSINLKRRIDNLYIMERTIEMLKSEIGFGGRIIEDAFRDIGEHTSRPFSDFFKEISSLMKKDKTGCGLLKIWTDCEYILYENSLNEKDIQIFRRIAKEIGFMDVQMQLKTLSLVDEQLRSHIEEVNRNSKGTCRVYQSLGLLGAMAVWIIML